MTAPITLDTSIGVSPCPTKPSAVKPATSRPAEGHHGTPRGYRLGCRNNCCRDPNRRYKKRHARFGTLKVDPKPAANHIRALLAGGATKQAIADAADTSTYEIWAILSGKHATIRQATRDKILAVDLSNPTGAQNATGTARRLRALLADGHTVGEITETSGISASTVTHLINGALETVGARIADAVADAYAVMSLREGSNVRNRLRGERERWGRPTHWDGTDIDDPDAFPNWTGACGTYLGRNRHYYRKIPLCRPCADAFNAECRVHSAIPGGAS